MASKAAAESARNRGGGGAGVGSGNGNAAHGEFQDVVGCARSLRLFTCAGARAPYLVREIVQNARAEYYLQRARF
jgi:hypothetical protein